ncbi:N-methylhydantoinase B [Roseovarius lutimaris]|uniref:N-methylhydantoinase B n=1 Tax=Roseovarius lutimaris TaxID=1005928 RepID=A0A1I5GYP5_9RHOB|nr:hydantoinase B/oxoprolinase family protein [Roseovarius lutimaris]SFO41000.1 N-methylhydantoinase B [Roseovarius lutimaris]
MISLDPILLEILGNKLRAATEEMGHALQRTGRTLYVKETADFGTALADLDGHFFAYPRAIGVSGFIDLDCGPTLRAVEDLKPGDVIITNHPYDSEGLATHAPDAHLLMPYFYEGELVCFGWSFVHLSDVGGRVPSSISPTNHELYQEGLFIPPLKLLEEKKWNNDVLSFIKANCRTPDENIGDLKAMIAALNVGERRVAAIIERHGIEAFRAARGDLQTYAATKSRDVLRQIGDGSYHFIDYMDDDLVSSYPIRLEVTMTARDGEIHLDFTGTDPQVEAAFNVPTNGKRHAWLTVRMIAFIMTMDPTTPMNAGMFRPITVTVPKGTVLNPVAPAAVGVRHATAVRVNDLLNGVLGKALPEVMPAASGGAMVPIVFAADDPKTGATHVAVVEPMVGGSGARKGSDGVDGRDSSISNLANNPIETVESQISVSVLEYGIRPDSGGAGKWRGGVGVRLRFRIEADTGRILGRGMERFRFRPWGLFGGCPGAPMRVILNEGTDCAIDTGRIDMLPVKKGDTLTVLMPGGGGYGDPLERAADLVLADVAGGFLSEDVAAASYGVVIEGGTIDLTATEARRADMRKYAPSHPADNNPGVNRAAWDAAISNDVVASLNAVIQNEGASNRSRHRRDFYSLVLPDLDASEGSFEKALSDPNAVKARVQEALEAISR